MHDGRLEVWRTRAGRLMMGAGANVASALGGAIRNKLFAHFLGTAGMGALAQVLTASTWVGTGAGMGLQLPVARAVGAASAAGDDATVRRVVSTALTVVSIAVVGVVALVALNAPRCAAALLGPRADPALMVIALIAVAGLAVQAVVTGLFAGRSDLSAPLTYAILGNLAATAAVLALVPFFGLRGAVLGAACFYPAAILGTLVWHRRAYRPAFRPVPVPRFDRGEAGAMLRVAAAALVMAVVDQGVMLGVRTHFAHTLGLAQNGLFQSALALSQQGGAVFYTYLSSYAFGRVSGAVGVAEVRRYTQRQWTALMAVAAAAFATAMLIATPLLHLLFSRQFDPARPMLLWTLFGEFAKVGMQAWMLGALPLGGVRLFMPLGLAYVAAFAAGYAGATALGFGAMSLAAAYAFAGVFALVLAGVVMTVRGVPLTPRGLLLLLGALAGLAALAATLAGR
jgi:O-antigen/teichoic acid export membrane protein